MGSMTEKEPVGEEELRLETVDTSGVAIEDVSYTDSEAKRVRRRLDIWLMPVLMITYGLQYWDKSLTGQAVQFNFAKDLGLVKVIGIDGEGHQISSSKRLANTTLIFYIGYLVSAYPAALLTQRLPTAKVCAGAIFVWSIIIMSTPACKNYGQIMVNRLFLGCVESFIGPAFVVYVTFWWTRSEQSLRSSLWWGMTGVAGMVSPLISWGLGHVHGAFGMSTWKYMFLVAGGITMLWSLVVLIVLPDNPKSAKWLNERDRAIVIARIQGNNAGVVNHTFKIGQVFEALLDYNLWSNAFICASAGIPNAVFSSFGTLVISGFGYGKFDALLLLIPLGFTAALSVFVTGYVCQRFKDMRYFALIFNCTIALVGSLVAWLGPRDKPSVLYAGVVLMTFIIPASAVSIGLTSSNCAGHTKKSTISGAVFIGYCLGNIVGPLCFTSTPGPLYSGGFISCVVVNAVNILVALYGRYSLRRENHRRDREYGPSATGHALHDLTDRENKDFRYVF